AALQSDDSRQVAALKTAPPPPLKVGEADPGVVIVNLHSCPGCDQSFADVVHSFAKRKETKSVVKLKRVRGSPEALPPLLAAPLTEGAGAPTAVEEESDPESPPEAGAEVV